MNTTNPQRPERDDDTQVIETAEITELNMPMSERFAEFDEATTELPADAPTDEPESPEAGAAAEGPMRPERLRPQPAQCLPPTRSRCTARPNPRRNPRNPCARKDRAQARSCSA